MSNQRIATQDAPGAIGPYSQAIDTGAHVFCSGQLGLDPATGALVGEGIAEQLTDQRLIVALERLPPQRIGDDTRIARLTPVGPEWADRLRGLPELVEPTPAAPDPYRDPDPDPI